MGNLTFSKQIQGRLDAEVATMEIMFPGTTKEIQLSRALMTALDEMKNFSSLSDDARQAFIELYDYYQWQMEQGYP